jgi:tetratricopeptide (TPR) repeat protein
MNLAIDKRNSGKMRSAVIWFKKAIAMKNGEASVALAKIYKDRKGGRKAAERLLREALRLDRDHISDAARRLMRSRWTTPSESGEGVNEAAYIVKGAEYVRPAAKPSGVDA